MRARERAGHQALWAEGIRRSSPVLLSRLPVDGEAKPDTRPDPDRPDPVGDHRPGAGLDEISEEDTDLTTNTGTGSPAIGERIIVTGRVLDENGRGMPGTVIEIWQPNASGRYAHWRETEFPAPLDPNFVGVGQCLTDVDGGYRFTTIKPGPYPWGNHPNAWRPAAHPFLDHGAVARHEAGHPDVFPGRPPDPARPDLQLCATSRSVSNDRHLRP